MVSSSGAALATVATVAEPVAGGPVRTTIDLSAQAAAQQAANRAPNSSVAIVQPSTGDILAIANNPPGGIDTAMIGALAPGSTFKAVSTTLLLDDGLVDDLGRQVPCPRVLEADGVALHNSEDEAGMDNSFLQDFAQSCNNAFSGFYRQVTTAEVARTAQTYFGFDEPWDIGLHEPTTYAKVPQGSTDSVAEEMVGQDRITASPLAMASVAATVATGAFEQPILIPGTAQRKATPLPAATRDKLRTLMHTVVTQGTLAGVIGDAGETYGKTGTAEVGADNNSWTIAYRGDLAVCALAVHGGFGAAVAGPEVDTVLSRLAP
jgi:cell division protein FtsI/penicillin-binding protein 2